MISHRLHELYGVAGTATVLRDGRVVADVPLPSTPESELVRLMVGRDLGDYYRKRTIEPGETVLEVEGLRSRDGRLAPTTLSVRRGEIVGVAGLAGSGKAELGLALAGAIPSEGACASAAGPPTSRSPRSALASGIGFVPDDRQRAGAAAHAQRGRELLRRVDRRAHARRRAGRALGAPARARGDRALRRHDRVAADAASPRSRAATSRRSSSGGCSTATSRCSCSSEPTRGIDVGAKSEIYRLMQERAEQGAAILVISSELPELLGIADRILVFFRGEVRGEFAAAGLEEEQLAHVVGLRRAPGARGLTMRRYAGVLVALVLLCAYLSITEDVFLTWGNLTNIAKSNSVVFVLAIGATFVVISAGIDLSTASATAAAGMILGLTMDAGWSIVLALAATVLFGVLLGLLNGILITKLRISFLVVTLGTLSIYQSFALIVNDGQTITTSAKLSQIDSGRGSRRGTRSSLRDHAAVDQPGQEPKATAPERRHQAQPLAGEPEDHRRRRSRRGGRQVDAARDDDERRADGQHEDQRCWP